MHKVYGLNKKLVSMKIKLLSISQWENFASGQSKKSRFLPLSYTSIIVMHYINSNDSWSEIKCGCSRRGHLGLQVRLACIRIYSFRRKSLTFIIQSGWRDEGNARDTSILLNLSLFLSRLGILDVWWKCEKRQDRGGIYIYSIDRLTDR